MGNAHEFKSVSKNGIPSEPNFALSVWTEIDTAHQKQRTEFDII